MTKGRSDSAHIQTEQIAKAIAGIKIPKHLKLREGDLPFWQAIISARAEWTDVDLTHAANLARCQADIEKIQGELDKEGHVLENRKGTPVMNPKHNILETLSRRSVALARMVQVHAAATIGESKLNRGKNSAKSRALQAAKEVDDGDELLAKPSFH